MGNGSSKSSINKIISWDEQEVAPNKQNVRAAWIQFFLEPLQCAQNTPLLEDKGRRESGKVLLC